MRAPLEVQATVTDARQGPGGCLILHAESPWNCPCPSKTRAPRTPRSGHRTRRPGSNAGCSSRPSNRPTRTVLGPTPRQGRPRDHLPRHRPVHLQDRLRHRPGPPPPHRAPRRRHHRGPRCPRLADPATGLHHSGAASRRLLTPCSASRPNRSPPGSTRGRRSRPAVQGRACEGRPREGQQLQAGAQRRRGCLRWRPRGPAAAGRPGPPGRSGRRGRRGRRGEDRGAEAASRHC